MGLNIGWKTKAGLAFALVGGLTVGGIRAVEDWTYSEGARKGPITKLSKKGILCKTWEGQMAQSNFSTSGSRTNNEGTDNTFYFSIDNDETAKKVKAAMDSGQEVNLGYEQKLFAMDWVVPGFCQRRTEYEIVSVKPTRQAPVRNPMLPQGM